MPQNPVRSLRAVSVETDRRHDRRSPTRAEVAELFRHLDSGAAPAREGMTGQQRRLGYALCMATGYRAGELRSLTRDSFDWQAGTVTVAAAYSKRRRQDTQQLPPWLAEELREWLEAGGGLWGGFPSQFPGRLLKADLAAARAAWVAAGEAGRVRGEREGGDFLRYETKGRDGPLFWDFHALRHFYITELAKDPAVSLKTLMHLARHSTPELTLKRYAKPDVDQARAAIDRFGPLG